MSLWAPVRHNSRHFFVTGKRPPGISDTSAKSTLLGISCSNTFFIDLYQRPCLQSECGWARYKIAWHKILSVCQHRQLLPSAKQNKQVRVHLQRLCNVCFIENLEQVLQAVTGYKSTCFLICRVLFVDWAERNATMILFKVMQQLRRVKQHLIQIATGAVLTYDIDVQLRAKGGVDKQKERQRLNNTYWKLSSSYTSSTGIQLRFLPAGSQKLQDLTENFTCPEFHSEDTRIKLHFAYRASFQTMGAKMGHEFFLTIT